MKNTPPVEAVRRAARILDSFRPERPELGVSEIARELNMHKSTVHRLLATLELDGFVHRIDGSRYTLGWKLFELGAIVPGWHRLRQVVLDVLGSLVAETGETAHLAVLDEGQVLYVEKVESQSRLRMPSAVGKRIPTHCTALGKVLLAGLGRSELDSFLEKIELEPFTPNTITDRALLNQELSEVRTRGFAVDREELEEGLMCVGAPVEDERSVTYAAVSVAGPSSRIQVRLEDHVTRVQIAARSLSTALGSQAGRLRQAGSTFPASA
jgi:DNA-binding IclR family transcriptional regulator